MSFARFMAGPVGRGLRIVAGIVLIVVGISIAVAASVILGVFLLVRSDSTAAGSNQCSTSTFPGAPTRLRRGPWLGSTHRKPPALILAMAWSWSACRAGVWL